MPHPRTRRAQRKVKKEKKQFSSKLLDSPGRVSKKARRSKSVDGISVPQPGSLGRKLK